MIVRNVPLISFIAAPRVLGSKEATTIVTRGVLALTGAHSSFPLPDITPMEVKILALEQDRPLFMMV
jgi:hypothetical protein